ncbi:unnamed protein product [Owenia fusiformis]|uniref:Uncharacterized protein n=1 Tax=Owenia fusiformis TaxID=6347 RepID=A0A8S4P8S6_OWEFU|nr:unnamed protein product [Owenia fusiformis]
MHKGAICRRAIPEDHKGIMEINDNIYEGLDYIPALFPIYVEQPFRHCFVCEQDGKIMAYMQWTIIDGGHSRIGQANRSIVGSKGYFKQLDIYTRAQMEKLCPGTRIVYTAIYGDYQQKKTKDTERIKVMEMRYRRVYVINANQDTSVLETSEYNPTGSVQRINAREMEEIVLKDRTTKHLFPADNITCGFEPLSTTQGLNCNIQHIFKHATVSASFNNGNTCEGISFLGSYLIKLGIRSNFDFYGSDDVIFRCHIIEQAKEALKVARARNMDLYFCVHFPQTFSLETLDEYATKVLGWEIFEPLIEDNVYIAAQESYSKQ